MKRFFGLFCLVVLLLATTAVPFVETRQQVANGWPTPWPKKPAARTLRETPQQIANGWPTPWPKKPGFVLS